MLHVKDIFSDVRAEVLKRLERQFCHIHAFGFSDSYRGAHNFMRIAKGDTLSNQVISKVGRCRMPKLAARRIDAGFADIAGTRSAKASSESCTVRTASKTGSLSSWLSLL